MNDPGEFTSMNSLGELTVLEMHRIGGMLWDNVTCLGQLIAAEAFSPDNAGLREPIREFLMDTIQIAFSKDKERKWTVCCKIPKGSSTRFDAALMRVFGQYERISRGITAQYEARRQAQERQRDQEMDGRERIDDDGDDA